MTSILTFFKRATASRSARAAQAETQAARTGLDAANEGLLDRDLLSADPIGAWLSRYLTPTAG